MAVLHGFFSLLILIGAAITGLLIFTKGFLLNRVAIVNVTHTTNDTTTPAQYRKVVLLVIDALRYDFVAPQPNSQSYYHNNLPFVHSLLTEHRQQTRLFKFVADPPTTTMQRLKGLTTGGLPTFVDAGSNFASSEITEDNIIQQLVNNNKSVVCMGDDTWESLFAGRFTRSYPFPSFNVQDLHTVDRGVQKHLIPEMIKGDYSLLIAHFLGVDHCGHRYGPDHPAMQDKLTEMNDVIKSVVDNLDEETLLVVLGDHGMTKTGDHGGDSDLEVNAALLLYSKREAVWSNEQEVETVSQIDLVPTLSLLMGQPVPYSNLGSLISEVMYDHKSQDGESLLLRALQANQLQISGYLRHYNQISNDLPKPEMAVLLEMENSLRSLSSNVGSGGRKLMEKHRQYMTKAKIMCQRVWAKFDESLMLIGCLQVLYTLLLQIAAAVGVISPSSSYRVLSCQAMLTLTSLLLCYLQIFPSYSMIVLTFTSALSVIICSSKEVKMVAVSRVGVVSTVCLAMLCLCSLSNSLLVHEDMATYYIVLSALWFAWAKHIVTSLRQEQLKMKERVARSYTYIWRALWSTSTHLLLAITCVLRIALAFRACREEQDGCEVSLFFTPLSSLREELSTYRNARFWLLSVPAVVLPVMAVNRVMTVRGNLNGYSPLTLFSAYGLPIMSMLVLVDWAAGSSSVLEDWQRTFFARAVYILFLISVTISFAWPKSVYLTANKPQLTQYNGSISSLYNQVKKSLNDGEERRPYVYGLGTVYSALYLVFVTSIALVLMMIAGDGMAFPLCLLLITVFLFLDMHQHSSEQASCSIHTTICWFLFCKYYFYSTGDQPTITNIRWDSAFHGFAKEHDNDVIPAILLFSSTFSSQVIFMLTLPMLLVVKDSLQTFYQSVGSPSSRAVTGVGEVALTHKHPQADFKLVHIFHLYLLAHLSKSFASLCAAAILRRHLMVWKIFAPAFIYEGASFILTSIVALVSYLLYVRVSSAVRRYIANFDLQHVD